MAAIKSIELINFQPHYNRVLEFGKFTALTGPSHSGKSSVLRAVRGLLKNESVGRYVSYGKKTLEVKVTMDDETVVEWHKGGGENSYLIRRPDGSEQHFQKVGAEVPEEVSEVLKLIPITLEGGQKLHVNMHSQLEAPFLISETAGYAAKVFGELTSASKIYAAVSEGNKSVRSNLALKKTRRSDLDSLKLGLQEYENLDSYQLAVAELRTKLNDSYTELKGINAVEELSKSISKQRDFITYCDGIIAHSSGIEDVTFEGVEEISNKISSLIELNKSIEKKSTELTTLDNVVSAFEDALTLNLDEASGLSNQYVGIQEAGRSLNGINESVSVLSSEIGSLEKQLLDLVKTIDTLHSELESCPSCGQELEGNAKEHLLGEVMV